MRKRVDKEQQEKEPDIFRETLAPGTAVIMTQAGNISTQHAVPEVEEAGMSGSIVFRTITDVIPPAQVEKELAKRGMKRLKKPEPEEDEDVRPLTELKSHGHRK